MHAVILLAAGAAAPAPLPAEQEPFRQAALLRMLQARKAWDAGKHDAAIAAALKAVAAAEALYGPDARLPHSMTSWPAAWEERRGRHAEAAKHRERMWRQLAAMRGPDDHEAIDARWEWVTARRRAGLSAADNARLTEAYALRDQGVKAQQAGEYARALPLIEKAGAGLEATLGTDHPYIALNLATLALLHFNLGDHAAALPPATRSLAIRKGALGERHPDRAAALHNLATLRHEMGMPNAALDGCREALAVRHSVLGPAHADTAQSLALLGRLRMDTGEYGRALLLLEASLAACKAAHGEKHREYAAALNNLARLRHEMGQLKEALALYEKALDTRAAAQGRAHPEYAMALANLALIRQDLGDFKAALPLAREALALRRAALGERHPETAQSQNNLAVLYQMMGEPAEARALFEKALAVHRKAFGEKHPATMTSQNNLAAHLLQAGDTRAALALYEKALALRKAAFGEKHRLYALSLNNLAHARKEMGDLEGAIPLFERALRIHRDTLGEGHPETANSMSNLALAYNDAKRHAEALPLLRRALAAKRAALGPRHPSCTATLNGIAGLLRAVGDNEGSLKARREALALARESPGDRHPLYALILEGVGFAHYERGDARAALPFVAESLRISSAVHGEAHPDTATGLNNLAGVHLILGDADEARRLSERALTLTSARLRSHAAIQSEREQLASAADMAFRLDVRLSLPDGGGYGHALARKGAILMRQQERRLFARLADDPKARASAADLQRVTRVLAGLSRSPRPPLERLAELTAEQERLQGELSRLSAEARAARGHLSVTPAALTAALPEGVALIDYHFFNHVGVKDREGRPRFIRHLSAFVTRKGRAAVRIDLGPADPIIEATREWRVALVRGQASAPRLAAATGRLLWAPLADALAGATLAAVSPDGPLGRVPWAALPGKKEGSYLIEDHAIAVVPAPQELPGLLAGKPGGPMSLLAVGGVDFGEGEWAALPATGLEAEAVKGLFPGKAAALSGKAAGKAALREALGGHRYAHLATHGFFAPASLRSALDPAPGDYFGRGGVAGRHPLLLSGIVLAGANAGQEDGILTALEVSEMDLPKLELVVLSACETGLGQEAGGEGLLGLQRAFAVAGCRGVCASLWSVDDAATSVLMERFYLHLWAKKLGKAAALRAAQIDVLRNPGWVEERVKRLAGTRGVRGAGLTAEKVGAEARRSPPAWWAAFVLSGDWR